MKIDLLIELIDNIENNLKDEIELLRRQVGEIKGLELRIKAKQYIGTVVIYRKMLKKLRRTKELLHKEGLRYIDFLIKESTDEEQRMRLKKASLNSPEYNKILDKISRMK